MPGDLTYFKKNAVNYYGVFYERFDKGSPYNDILTNVRKKYYESKKSPQKDKFIVRNENGIFRYNYSLHEDTILKWKVFNESRIVERVIVSKEGAYRIEIRDRSGKLLKSIHFGAYHNWLKTKYYSDNQETPETELDYWEEKGIEVILKYTADNDDNRPELLYPCQAVEDKELFAKITERLGVPEVCTLCTSGLVYFADKNTSKQWNTFCEYPEKLEPEPAPVPDPADEQPVQSRSKLSYNTVEFEPLMEKFKPKQPEERPVPSSFPKKRIDLTQTFDVIVPNQVASDSVVINKNSNDNGSQSENGSSPISSRSFEHNANDSSDSSNTSSPELSYGSSEGSKKTDNKNVDVFDFLSDDDGEAPDTPVTDGLTLDIELSEDDEDSDIIRAENQSPDSIYTPVQRAYEYKKVRDSKSSESSQERTNNSGNNIESISYEARKKTLEDVRKAIESGKYFSEDSDTSVSSAKSVSLDKPSGNSVGKSISADKIIKVSEKDVYYYYGGLNSKGKRSGYGRTAMKNGRTAYDGEYSSDLRDGFGVYYYRNGKICYVGDWKENHRDGVGISFNHKDRSMYAGRWESDRPTGMGAKFDENGLLTFAGRYEDGVREGIGIVYRNSDGGVFVSRWEHDKPAERGTLFDAMGNLVYSGSWKKGARNGIGTQYDKKGLVVYSGEWKDGKYHGEGTLNLSNGYKIVGEFEMGRIEGYAIVTSKKGKKIYEGYWKNSRYHGEGKVYNVRDGSWCQGTFANGNAVGILKGYSKDGELLYEGEWKGSKYHGKGISYKNSVKVYEGEWADGLKQGIGSEYRNESCVYSGSFHNDMRNGFGTSYDSDGNVEYSGLWTDNCYDGMGLLYVSGTPRYAGCFKMGLLHGRVNEIRNNTVVKECIYNEGECVYMREFAEDGLTLIYEGRVKNGSHEGMGCAFTPYGEKSFEGIFKNNQPSKSMKIRFKKLDNLPYSEDISGSEYTKYIKGSDYVVEQDYNSGSYSGLLVKGKPFGKGTITYVDHGYTGDFIDGFACGNGVIYKWDGTEIKGVFTKFPNENTTEINFANDVVYYLKNN